MVLVQATRRIRSRHAYLIHSQTILHTRFSLVTFSVLYCSIAYVDVSVRMNKAVSSTIIHLVLQEETLSMT